MMTRILLNYSDCIWKKKDIQVGFGCGWRTGNRTLFGRKSDIVLLDIMMPKLDGWQGLP